MAKRRRSRKKEDSTAFLLLVFGLVLLSIVVAVVNAVAKAVRSHPVVSVLVLLLLVAAAAGGSVLWWQERARKREVQAVRAREITSYHAMNARQFEEALAYLCGRDGCSRVRVVGGAGDLGADVIATTPQGDLLVIQAKRYRTGNKVTGPDLQKFGGTCYSVHRATVAAVVTTSSFTAQARDYADHMKIRLFGNESLAAWASQTGPPPWG